MSTRPKDLTGWGFGRLTAIALLPPDRRASGRSMRQWKCLCSCGAVVIVRSANLLSGDSRSCGCLNRDKLHAKYNTGHYLYPVWGSMKDRCTNPNNSNWKHY